MNINLAPFRHRHYNNSVLILGEHLRGSKISTEEIGGQIIFSSGENLISFESEPRKPDYVFCFGVEFLMASAGFIYDWAEKNPLKHIFLPNEIEQKTASGSSFRQSFDSHDFTNGNVELVCFRAESNLPPSETYYGNLSAGVGYSEIELLTMLDFAVYMGFREISFGVNNSELEIYEGVSNGVQVFNKHLEKINDSLTSDVSLNFVRL